MCIRDRVCQFSTWTHCSCDRRSTSGFVNFFLFENIHDLQADVICNQWVELFLFLEKITFKNLIPNILTKKVIANRVNFKLNVQKIYLEKSFQKCIFVIKTILGGQYFVLICPSWMQQMSWLQKFLVTYLRIGWFPVDLFK